MTKYLEILALFAQQPHGPRLGTLPIDLSVAQRADLHHLFVEPGIIATAIDWHADPLRGERGQHCFQLGLVDNTHTHLPNSPPHQRQASRNGCIAWRSPLILKRRPSSTA